MAEHPDRNISRIAIDKPGEGWSGPTHGFMVRIMRRGTLFQKFFRDSVHGGKDKALAAAREFRDKCLKRLNGYSRKEVAEIVSQRNTSGVPGVSLQRQVHKRGGSEYEYLFWVAQWKPTPNTRKKKLFSVSKYGEEEAFRLAVEARKKGIAEMEE